MVEDAAVRNKTQALDWVDFNGYKIYLITFKRISVACTVNSQPDSDYMDSLEDRVMDFAKGFYLIWTMVILTTIPVFVHAC